VGILQGNRFCCGSKKTLHLIYSVGAVQYALLLLIDFLKPALSEGYV
jgi:hypothetical protein